MKKLRNISILLTMVIFLSNFNILPARALENLDKTNVNTGSITELTPIILQDPSELNTNGGYIPSPIKVKKSFYPINKGLYKATVLPEKYDLRTYGYVTNVRNQGSIGACWTFSTYGSLESTIKKSSGKAYDFSEIHMAVYNGDVGPDDGGNNHIATSYLVSGKGPILESEAPYPNPAVVSNINVSGDLKAKYRVKDIIFLPSREHSLDNDEIKNAIITYGAVSSSYYDNSSYYTYNGQASYYNKYTSMANHAITIIGWDDKFSKNNFKVVPPGDGAFIVKNSWGTNWGDNGYFYISYYDISLGYDSNAVFYDIEDINAYKNMYKHTDKGPYAYYPVQSSIAAGNRFKAKESESISAVGFYTFSQNVSYEIWIDKIVSGNITKATTKVASGTLAQGGYHTIKLQNEVTVAAGQEFMVWIKLSADSYYGERNSSLANGKSYIQSASGYTQNSSVAFLINAYSKGVDFSQNLAISSVTPENDEIAPNESITINFNDDISKGSDYSKISLKDENGVELQKSITISGKKLIIKEIPENHLYGKLKIYIPKTAVKNSKGKYMYNDYTKEYLVYPAADTVVTFRDSALENAIRSELGKHSGNITAGDMRTLEELYLSHNAIINLSGLEYAVRLKSLDLNNNQIISVKPLNTLTALESLYLEGNSIKDISPLSNLKNLKYLNINYNSIRDISMLSNLISLESLYVCYNLIDNISALEELNNLEIINISNNLIKDISPLKKLVDSKKVTYLTISLYENYIDFAAGSTARTIVDSLANMGVVCYGQDSQYSSMQVAGLNNKNSALYYQIEYMPGESVVVEYNQPISLASNAKNLITLEDGFTPLDFNMRAAGSTLIITPLTTNYESSYLYLTIGQGAVKSKSSPDLANPEEYFFFNISNKLYGDVDSNGIVDVLDLAAIASSYNSSLETDTGWSLKKDLNRDGIIDVYDLSIWPQGRAVNVK